MSDAVVIALIGSVQAVTLGILGIIIKYLSTIKKDSSETKEQIVNHHAPTPNFREENDERHAETKRLFSGLAKLVRTMESSFNTRLDNIETVIDDLNTVGTENRDRIIDLEDTDRMVAKKNGRTN